MRKVYTLGKVLQHKNPQIYEKRGSLCFIIHVSKKYMYTDQFPFLLYNRIRLSRRNSMSVNDEKYQEMTRLLVEQMTLRPETVLANLNCLLQERNINLELRLLRADPIPEHLYQWPLITGEKMIP